MNTTFRCATMAVVQLYVIFYAAFVFCTTLSFSSGTIIYTKAMLNDIKSLFCRIDKISKSKNKNAELTMLTYCKEAVDLHVGVLGYAFYRPSLQVDQFTLCLFAVASRS